MVSMKRPLRWGVGLLGLSLLLILFYLGYRFGMPVLSGYAVGTDTYKGDVGTDTTYGRLTLMFLIATGTLVSEDLACIGAGLLSGTGRLDFLYAAGASFIGIFTGDLIIFWMGSHFGRPIMRHRWARWFVSERSLNRAQQLFREYGIWIVLITRFVPGTRTATYFSAGALHAPAGRFIAVFALAALLWTPVLVGFSHLVGERLVEMYHVYEAFALPAIVLAGLTLFLILKFGMPLLTWRGRRELKGKWMRAVRWEFWPVWQVNWLTFLYVLYLGLLRYKKPTLFTAVNPCMAHGGFLGESKGEIMKGLARASDALPATFRFEPGDPRERLDQFRELLSANRLGYPVVLKPDEGQRGAGVRIVREEAQARNWFEEHAEPALLQEFLEGSEYGVFYVRRPSEPEGRIISLTIKEQLEVVGNGADSLEVLIYRHPRAIALLYTFLKRFENDLERVPFAGERIRLGELGTHARGALFLDGRDLITPELTRRIDRIAKACDGFYFGRFDIMATSVDALRCGRGLKVIELNGVTSESTHIYDPRHGLFTAWRTLMAQWKLAFEIADENARAGAPVSSVKAFTGDLLKAWRRQGSLSRN